MFFYLLRARPTNLLQLTGFSLIIGGGSAIWSTVFFTMATLLILSGWELGNLHRDFQHRDIAIMAGIILVLYRVSGKILRHASHPRVRSTFTPEDKIPMPEFNDYRSVAAI
jgi:hypothetical protein